MQEKMNFTPSRKNGRYPGNNLVEYAQPSNFSTLQFLVSSEIAGILLLGNDQGLKAERHPQKICQIDSIANVARLAATAIHHPPLNKELEKKYVQLVYSLVTIIDACDTCTLRHGPRTGHIALLISQVLGLSKKERNTIHIAGILHDIGKIGIPESVLTKQGKLTVKEWKSMKSHPLLGAQILTPISRFQNISGLVEAHHEKYNGTGYPHGLQREEIPLGARILAIADAFTTMTDGRIYRPPFKLDEAIAELKICAGSHFDPAIVPAALDAISQETV
ncbi:MAG: HD domain-containing protein [Anaerolineaceae bacterium]|nr:HD domain-containing protein [Anaerolineaceae bacterium]